jgi:D-glycero-D-manno-heptose 1,7-bisphosphate phosphatase
MSAFQQTFNVHKMSFLQEQPDKSWTLFLDRDGVINRLLVADYVKNWGEFEILPGVLEAIAELNQIFGRVIVVTNQQGIGKELMTEEDLALIHLNLLQAVQQAGGHIDRIFHCPHLADSGCPCRKPAPGMINDARMAFPDIDLKKAILVGDSDSDVALAHGLGMPAVLVGGDKGQAEEHIQALSDLPGLVG